MDRLWLTFRNPSTERQYELDALRRVLMRQDDAFLLWWLVVGSVVAARSIIFVRDGVYSACWALHVMYTAWEIWKRSGMSTTELFNGRTTLVYTRRCAHWALVLASLTRDRGLDLTNPFTLSLKTGLFPNLYVSDHMRLKFSRHVPCQVFIMLVSVLFLTKGPCQVAMETSLGPWISALSKSINAMSDLVMAAVGGGSVDLESPAQCPCEQIIVWLDVFFLTVFVSLRQWMHERSSRISFIRTLPLHRQKEENLDAVADISDWKLCIYVLVLVSFVGSGWKLNFYLVRATERFGMAFN